jgi:spore coat protein U-like protein
MKNSKVVLAALATVFMAQASLAATSGSLLLRGVVGVVNEITVAAEGSDNLNLNILGGESNKLVGKATEKSNNLAGYKITISSPTNGQLRHTVDATKYSSYTISYGGASAVAPTVSGVQVKNVTSLNSLTTNISEIRANITANPNAVAGTYEDTLTVTITAN